MTEIISVKLSLIHIKFPCATGQDTDCTGQEKNMEINIQVLRTGIG